MNDNEILYKMIFKRKSFHLFRNLKGNITDDDIDKIKEKFKTFIPLNKDIKVEMQINNNDAGRCSRGQEKLIFFYSENKKNYLQNIGYLGEQLDLYLASLNIGTLWFGIGSAKEKKFDELDFVIMIAIGKYEESDFRRDMFKSKRKNQEDIWQTAKYQNIANIIRFAPSACNTQPWIVKEEGNDLFIYRYKKNGKRGIMPFKMINYYNKIDIGIFMAFLDICLDYNNILYKKEIKFENDNDEEELHLNCIYHITN